MALRAPPLAWSCAAAWPVFAPPLTDTSVSRTFETIQEAMSSVDSLRARPTWRNLKKYDFVFD